MKEKILIICPNFPPSMDGLAGHTYAFALALAIDKEVHILTSKTEIKAGLDESLENIFVHRIVENWNIFGLRIGLQKIKETMPSKIILQYLPFLYNTRGGVNFSICFFAILLRTMGFRIDLVCHELYYPPHLSTKALVMFSAHILMLTLLGVASRNIFASTEDFLRKVKIILFWHKMIFWLPVGSNMAKVEVPHDKILAFAAKYSLQDCIVFAIFGTQHPTRDFELVLKCICDWSDHSKEKVAILCIGEKKESIFARLTPETANRSENKLRCLGKLDTTDFALAMENSDMAIAYFSDGASTRRGSLLATLQYGLPTISSESGVTEKIFSSIQGLWFLPADREKFKAGFPTQINQILALKDRKLRVCSAEFDAIFGWRNIVRQYHSHSDVAFLPSNQQRRC